MKKKRKTKAKKLKAKLRRLEKRLEQEERKETNESLTQTQKKEQISGEKNYLLSDLRKTFVLTALALAIEFVIYWWLNLR